MSVAGLSAEEYYAATAKASRGVYSAEDVQRIHASWHWAEYPGVNTVVSAIESAGVATGALSNTSAPHWTDLRGPQSRYPTVARLRHAVASHLAGALKPSEQIFRAFEETSGSSGARILFFDDLAENVEAARVLGWNAEHIDPTGGQAVQLMAALRRYGVVG